MIVGPKETYLRRLGSTLLLIALGLSTAIVHARPQPRRPKLVVVIVLDQFRADFLDRFAPYFGPDGFERLKREGAYLTGAHYGHATTYTGPGHATILSGSYGHTNGIVGNRWYNRDTKQVETMLFDPLSKVLGVAELSPKEDDTSPRNFIGENLSDRLILSSGLRSKAVAVSLKDRAAVLLGGKLGKAYWFHETPGVMTSSGDYGKTVPEWVDRFNADHRVADFMGRKWEKGLPESDYAIQEPDDFKFETDFVDLGKTFPHTLSDPTGKPTAEFNKAFTATPFSVDYLLDFAESALDAEKLGRSAGTDLLGVSITSTDIAGHAWGPDSHEVEDLVVRVDRQLASFLRRLDRRFRKGETLVVLTADHGACPIPEYTASLGIKAGRIKKKSLTAAIEGALNDRYGKAAWIQTLEDPSVFIDPAVIAEKHLDPVEVEKTAGEGALKVEGISAYFTREQMITGPASPTYSRAPMPHYTARRLSGVTASYCRCAIPAARAPRS